MTQHRHPEESDLRIVVDARVRPGEQGGVQQTIMGLAAGLSKLDGPEHYRFLVDGEGGWLRPFLGGQCSMVQAAFPSPRGKRTIAAAERRLPGSGTAVRYLLETKGRRLPTPDRVLSECSVDVVHFMRHRGWRTKQPNLYVPHDLQHVHLPQLFSPQTRAYRRWVYSAMAAQATKIVALTQSQVEQLSTYFGRRRDDIVVVPWASLLPLYQPKPRELPPSLPPQVPDRFAFYPAHSWPHKNHLVLITALAHLRDRGIDIPVVLTGGGDLTSVLDFGRRNGVADLLIHLGYVDAAVVRLLYERAQMLVFPSSYEGFGLPVVEAMSAGTPVVCSDIAPLNRLGGGAARLFPPGNPWATAEAMMEVWENPELRNLLSGHATAQVSRLTWDYTALRYRSLYRQIAGRDTEEDRALLSVDPPV